MVRCSTLQGCLNSPLPIVWLEKTLLCPVDRLRDEGTVRLQHVCVCVCVSPRGFDAESWPQLGRGRNNRPGRHSATTARGCTGLPQATGYRLPYRDNGGGWWPTPAASAASGLHKPRCVTALVKDCCMDEASLQSALADTTQRRRRESSSETFSGGETFVDALAILGNLHGCSWLPEVVLGANGQAKTTTAAANSP